MSALAWAQVLRKLVSEGASGSRQRSTPSRPDGGHHAAENLQGVSQSLIVTDSRQEIALFGRTEDHERTPQVPGRLGQGDQVVAGPTANLGVGRREIKSLGLRQQPVQADRRQTGVLDHRAQLATTVRCKVRDPGSQGERSDLQSFVSQPLDGPANLAELPVLEQLVANSQSNHARILTQRGCNPPIKK